MPHLIMEGAENNFLFGVSFSLYFKLLEKAKNILNSNYYQDLFHTSSSIKNGEPDIY